MTIDDQRDPRHPRLRSGAVGAVAAALLTVVGCAVAARLETIAAVADRGGLLGPTLAPLGILPLGSGWPFRLAAGLIFGLGLLAVLRAAVGRVIGAADISAVTSIGLALIGIVVAAGSPPFDGGEPASSWLGGLLGEIGRSSMVLAWACAAIAAIGWRRRAAAGRPAGQPSVSTGGGETVTLPVIGSPDDRLTKQ